MIKISDKVFKGAINRVCSTDDGKIVFAYLKEILGWDNVYLSSDEPNVTQYYAARRGVYAGLRKAIKPEHLKQIEFNYTREIETDGSGRNKRRSNRNSTTTNATD